jgi:hypothetical protein
LGDRSSKEKVSRIKWEEGDSRGDKRIEESKTVKGKVGWREK